MKLWLHRPDHGAVRIRYFVPNSHACISSFKCTCSTVHFGLERYQDIFEVFLQATAIVNDTMSKHKEKIDVHDDKLNTFARSVPKVSNACFVFKVVNSITLSPP